MSPMAPIVVDGLLGVAHANVPELAAAAAAWYTFSDKPYGSYLALAQITDTLLMRSLIGLGVGIVPALIGKSKGNGNGNGGRRRRNKNRGGKRQKR